MLNSCENVLIELKPICYLKDARCLRKCNLIQADSIIKARFIELKE